MKSQTLQYLRVRGYAEEAAAPDADLARIIASELNISVEEVRRELRDGESRGLFHLVMERDRLRAVKPGPSKTWLQRWAAGVDRELSDLRRTFDEGFGAIGQTLRELQAFTGTQRASTQGLRRAIEAAIQQQKKAIPSLVIRRRVDLPATFQTSFRRCSARQPVVWSNSLNMRMSKTLPAGELFGYAAC